MGLAISCPVGHFQVDQFLFLSRSHCTCNALKQDYTPTGLTIPQSVDKIFNDWQPLRGKNEKFYRHIKCSDRKAGFPDRVPSSPPVSHARRARPQSTCLHHWHRNSVGSSKQALEPEAPGMLLLCLSWVNWPRAGQFSALVLYCTKDILFSIIC